MTDPTDIEHLLDEGQRRQNGTAKCNLTIAQLEGYLEKSDYGEKKGIFRCYFQDGMPPRCVACGELIGAHAKKSGSNNNSCSTEDIETEPHSAHCTDEEDDDSEDDHVDDKLGTPGDQQRNERPCRVAAEVMKALELTFGPEPRRTKDGKKTNRTRFTESRFLAFFKHHNVANAEHFAEEAFTNCRECVPPQRILKTLSRLLQLKIPLSTRPRCHLCDERFDLRGLSRRECRPLQLCDLHKKSDNDCASNPVCDECGVRPPLKCDDVDGMHSDLKGVKSVLFTPTELAVSRAWWSEHPDFDMYKCTQTVHQKSGCTGTTHLCNRRVCSECVKKSRHRVERSRFNHHTPEWQTSLLGCCASPHILCNTVACYYGCHHPSSMCDGYLHHFTTNALEHYVTQARTSLGDIILCFPFYVAFLPLTFLLQDILCHSIPNIRSNEREIRARFGLPAHSFLEVLFCRHCVYMRLQREAEARGYPQPTCCTSTSDVEKMHAQQLHPNEKSSNHSSSSSPSRVANDVEMNPIPSTMA